MNSYRAYGLEVQSQLELPELYAGQSGCDVSISIVRASSSTQPSNGGVSRFEIVDGVATYFNKNIGCITVRGGSEIVVAPVANVDEQLLRLIILGPAFAMALHQRGGLVLHASAVSLQGKAILLVGEKGRGKSTTANALHAAGGTFLTDDVAALTSIEGVPMIAPGFPISKIDPKALDAMREPSDELFSIAGHRIKKGRKITERFAEESFPVHHIVSLAAGSAVASRVMSKSDAMFELMRHSFAARWLPSSHADANNFNRCALLANFVPMHLLERPMKLSSLRPTIELIHQLTT
jgi:hypothetical protein